MQSHIHVLIRQAHLVGYFHPDGLCGHQRVKSRLSFLKNGRHHQRSCHVSRLQLRRALSGYHPTPTTNMHDDSQYSSSSHYTAVDYASRFLDTYAIPLDGTPTYANISDAVRMYPTITACSFAVPHGQRQMTGRAYIVRLCQGQTDEWSVRPRHQIARVLAVFGRTILEGRHFVRRSR